METCPVFPGLQTGLTGWRILLRVARQCGRTITIEECRAVCKQLWLSSEYGYQANWPSVEEKLNSTVPAMYANWVATLTPFLQKHLTTQSPTVGRQRICLPLGRRKGGEIRLSAEAAQVAMFGLSEEAPGNHPQGESSEARVEASA
jgi:hypothetical protein